MFLGPPLSVSWLPAGLSHAISPQEALQFLQVHLWIHCGLCGAAQESVLAQLLHVLVPIVTAAKSRPVSVVGTLIFLQISHRCQDLPSQLDNLIHKLQLHRGFHSCSLATLPLGLSFSLAPPLPVGHPQASVPQPGRGSVAADLGLRPRE